MKKIILLAIFNFLIFNLFFIFPSQIDGQENRFATCDQCGYCQNQPAPSNWSKCAQCLYPGITNPESGETLKINPETNLPPTPYPGRAYTMIGCVKTDLGSFEKEGAAASVVQVLLRLLFNIIGGIALIYLIYGTSIIMTSQANPERLNYGKRVVLGAIVGVIFSLSAVFLVDLLANKVLRIPGFGQ